MKNNNVIDMTERIKTPDFRERLKGLKVRLDLEQAKVAVSTSLLSIVLLVTMANNNLMTIKPDPATSMNQVEFASRGIASISGGVTGRMEPSLPSEDPVLVRELAQRDLSAAASVGRKPTVVEKFAFEYLEGKYAVRLHDGKIAGLELSDRSGRVEEPKKVEDAGAFLASNRELLPIEFHTALKVSTEKEGSTATEVYRLVDRHSMPVGKVEFRLDGSHGLLAMRVSN